jgi:hypothetical protein
LAIKRNCHNGCFSKSPVTVWQAAALALIDSQSPVTEQRRFIRQIQEFEMKDRRYIPLAILLGLGAVGGLVVVKKLASIPKGRTPVKTDADAPVSSCALAGAACEDASGAREWVVLYSREASSEFHYDGGPDPKTPPASHLTFGEARDAAVRYELHAQNIGGQAVIENVRTGQRIFEF